MERSIEALLRGGQFKLLLKKEYQDLYQQYHIKKVDLELLLAVNSLGNNVSPNDLMHFLSINKGYISQALLRLETLGYFEILKDPKDKRYHRIHLTKSGQVLSALADEKRKKIQNQMLKGISNEDYDCFIKVIQQISNNIEDLLTE